MYTQHHFTYFYPCYQWKPRAVMAGCCRNTNQWWPNWYHNKFRFSVNSKKINHTAYISQKDFNAFCWFFFHYLITKVMYARVSPFEYLYYTSYPCMAYLLLASKSSILMDDIKAFTSKVHRRLLERWHYGYIAYEWETLKVASSITLALPSGASHHRQNYFLFQQPWSG